MLEILNRTKRKLSARELLLFKKAYKAALPKGYELSLVFCTDKITDHNVLAYPLSKSEGEIFINPSRAGQFTLIELFVHACVHLTGGKHGKAMEEKEDKIHRKIRSGN
jgi:ssRNA-specific RNase YbeY (16S rRNA maturation enzyme)